MATKKKISNPTIEDEKELNDLLGEKITYVEVRGKQWKCGYLYHGTERKITDIVLNEKDEDKVSCKCCAALILNGLWKIKFFYWIVWRWFYYIKQYKDSELLPFITECKKKVEVEEYAIATILLTAMKDTIMTKTRAEVQRFQAEQLSAQLGQSQKKDLTSQQPSTTSEA